MQTPLTFTNFAIVLSHLIVLRLSGLGSEKYLTSASNYFDLTLGKIRHLYYISSHESLKDLGFGVPVILIVCKMVFMITIIQMLKRHST